MCPGSCVYVSQIDRPLPSSFHAPSIWYDEVATPQRNPAGKVRAAACPAGLAACCGRPAGASDVEQPAAAAAIEADAAFAKSRRDTDVDMVVLRQLVPLATVFRGLQRQPSIVSARI